MYLLFKMAAGFVVVHSNYLRISTCLSSEHVAYLAFERFTWLDADCWSREPPNAACDDVIVLLALTDDVTGI